MILQNVFRVIFTSFILFSCVQHKTKNLKLSEIIEVKFDFEAKNAILRNSFTKLKQQLPIVYGDKYHENNFEYFTNTCKRARVEIAKNHKGKYFLYIGKKLKGGGNSSSKSKNSDDDTENNYFKLEDLLKQGQSNINNTKENNNEKEEVNHNIIDQNITKENKKLSKNELKKMIEEKREIKEKYRVNNRNFQLGFIEPYDVNKFFENQEKLKKEIQNLRNIANENISDYYSSEDEDKLYSKDEMQVNKYIGKKIGKLGIEAIKWGVSKNSGFIKKSLNDIKKTNIIVKKFVESLENDIKKEIYSNEENNLRENLLAKGKESPTITKDQASIIARAVEGEISKILKFNKKVQGFIIKCEDKQNPYTIKLMNPHGKKNTAYFRITKNGKGALDKTGNFSNIPSKTYFNINLDTYVKDITNLLNMVE